MPVLSTLSAAADYAHSTPLYFPDNDVPTFEREHRHDGKKQGNECDHADPANRFPLVTLLALGWDEDQPGNQSAEKRDIKVNHDRFHHESRGELELQ